MVMGVSATYAYEKIIPLIEYSGARGRGYSPNNIRRLIISPDGAVVHYHIKTPSGRLMDMVRLCAEMVVQASSLTGYIPMMEVLHKERICASVEEVILLTRSNDGNWFLSGKELAFEGLVGTFRNKGVDLLETVRRRYVRLHDFTVADMSLNEFTRRNEAFMQGSGRGSGLEFLCDCDFLSHAKVQVVHEVKEVIDGREVYWFERWGSSAQAYSIDGVGGELHTHFTSFRDKKLEKVRRDAISASAQERLGSIRQECDKLLKEYEHIYKCYRRLYAMRRVGMNVCYKDCMLFEEIQAVILERCSVTEGYYNLVDRAGSEGDALRGNIELLKREKQGIYCMILKDFLMQLLLLGETRPITCKVIMRECERAVTVPPQMHTLVSYNERLRGITGYGLEGASFADSFANLCSYYVKFFVTKCGERSVDAGCNKEYWLNTGRKVV